MNPTPVAYLRKRSSIRSALLALTLAVACLAGAQTQTPLYPPGVQQQYVAFYGHSFDAQIYQFGLVPQEVPALSSYSVMGWSSWTCQMLLGPGGTNLLLGVPRLATIAVLSAGRNDVQHGVSVADHMRCVGQMVATLTTRNPNIFVMFTNVEPLGSAALQLYGDLRPQIAAYNSAYAQLPATYPNVAVVDTWTPMVDTAGVGLAYLFDSSGIHPSPVGWNIWFGAVRNSLYPAIAIGR